MNLPTQGRLLADCYRAGTEYDCACFENAGTVPLPGGLALLGVRYPNYLPPQIFSPAQNDCFSAKPNREKSLSAALCRADEPGASDLDTMRRVLHLCAEQSARKGVSSRARLD
jgi:hypothetical protein